MPTGHRYVKDHKGPKKWESYDKKTGKHKAWSTTEEDAIGYGRARDAAHHGAKLGGKRKR